MKIKSTFLLTINFPVVINVYVHRTELFCLRKVKGCENPEDN